MGDETRCANCHHPASQHTPDPNGTIPCRGPGHPDGTNCLGCQRLVEPEHIEAIMVMREDASDAFQAAWNAYRTTRDHVCDRLGDSWQAYFTDVHQSALASALIAYREQITNEGGM